MRSTSQVHNGPNLEEGHEMQSTDVNFRTPLRTLSRMVAITMVLLLLAAIPWGLQAQDESKNAQPGGGLSELSDLVACLQKPGNETAQRECFTKAGECFADKAANTALPDELGPVKQCLTALASAEVKLEDRSVAEKYEDTPGEAVGFL